MGIQRQPIAKFDGGLNLLDGPFALDPNEAQSEVNVRVTERNVLGVRPGLTALSSSGFPSGKVAEHIRPWYPSDGTKLLACSIDGSVYTMATNGALTSRVSGTAGRTWCFEQATDSSHNDRLWMLNGTDTPRKMTSAGTISNWSNAPNGTMCVLWDNRMVVAGVTGYPQRLAYSDIGNPESPASQYGIGANDGNWVDIKSTEDDLDPITWLQVVGNVLLVFKRRSVWAVYDSNSFTNNRLGRPGCVDRFQSCELDGRAYFYSTEGVFSVNTNSAPQLDTRLIAPIFERVNPSHRGKARMVTGRDRRIYLSLPLDSSSFCDYVIEGIPDMKHQRSDGHTEIPWYQHTVSTSSMCMFRSGNFDELVCSSGDDTKILRMFVGLDDDGDQIDAHWKTQWYELIKEEPFERIRRVNLLHQGSGVVDVFKDMRSTPSHSKIFQAPAPDDPLWDGGIWDGGPWDPVNPIVSSRSRPESRGRYHAFQFRTQPEGSRFTIYAAEAAWRGGKEH